MLVAWLVATGTFASAGAALAAIAWARSQYPLLAPLEAGALALRWSADLLPLAGGLGLAIAAGVRIAAPRARSARVAALVACAAVGLAIATRGHEAIVASDAVAPGMPASQSMRAAPDAPNLVLVTIDTLRADHLDAYGHPRPTAPSFAALAREGVLFETAISAAPATQLATASLLTGLWPWSHADPSRPRRRGTPYLRSGFATLAERLAAAGYATGGFVANQAVRAEEGFAQGFIAWDESAARSGRVEDVLAPALAWLADARAPFFLWVHVMDPHHPYDAPSLAPWEDAADAQAAALRRGWAALPFGEQTARMQAVDDEHDLDAATRALLVDRYDAEIRHADAGLARLLAALEQRGATRANTWIAVTADHGEEFLDHGRLLHGHTLFDELLHVPLVLRGPALPAGLRVAEQVATIDVAATLLAAAGLPSADLDARSLAPFWENPGREPARAALASREGKYVAWRTPEAKLVVAQVPAALERAPGGGLAALRWMARTAFDRGHRPKVGYWPVAEEPRELGIGAGRHADAHRAHAALLALRRSAPPRAMAEDAPIEPDARAVEQLRALGYAE